MVNNLGPQNAAYLFLFNIICIISAILSCELACLHHCWSFKVVLDQFMRNSSKGAGMLRRWYKKIYASFCYPTTLALNMYHNLFKKIYVAFKNITFTGRTKNQDQDDGGQIADIV